MEEVEKAEVQMDVFVMGCEVITMSNSEIKNETVAELTKWGLNAIKSSIKDVARARFPLLNVGIE